MGPSSSMLLFLRESHHARQRPAGKVSCEGAENGTWPHTVPCADMQHFDIIQARVWLFYGLKAKALEAST